MLLTPEKFLRPRAAGSAGTLAEHHQTKAELAQSGHDFESSLDARQVSPEAGALLDEPLPLLEPLGRVSQALLERRFPRALKLRERLPHGAVIVRDGTIEVDQSHRLGHSTSYTTPRCRDRRC